MKRIIFVTLTVTTMLGIAMAIGAWCEWHWSDDSDETVYYRFAYCSTSPTPSPYAYGSERCSCPSGCQSTTAGIRENIRAAATMWNQAGSEFKFAWSGYDNYTSCSSLTNNGNVFLVDDSNLDWSGQATVTWNPFDPDQLWYAYNIQINIAHTDFPNDNLYLDGEYNAYGTNETRHTNVYDVLSHEFGHIVGLEHNWECGEYQQYMNELTMNYGYHRVLTEDECFGARDYYGRDDRNIFMSSASRSNYDLTFGNAAQLGTTTTYQTYELPAIAGNPAATASTYDFIVAWIRSSTRTVYFQRFLENSPAALTYVGSPVQIFSSPWVSFRPPAVATNDYGGFVVAWHQEKQNASSSNYTNDNGYAKLKAYSTWNDSSPVLVDLSSTALTGSKARAMSGPAISYNSTCDKYVTAWIGLSEGAITNPPVDQDTPYRHTRYNLVVGISNSSSGKSWSSDKFFVTGKGVNASGYTLKSAWQAPEIECRGVYDNQRKCMLTLNGYNRNQRRNGENINKSDTYLINISSDCSTIESVSGPYTNMGYNLGRMSMAADDNGYYVYSTQWGTDEEGINYMVRNPTYGWDTGGIQEHYPNSNFDSIAGHSVAYNYRMGRWLFLWIRN